MSCGDEGGVGGDLGDESCYCYYYYCCCCTYDGDERAGVAREDANIHHPLACPDQSNRFAVNHHRSLPEEDGGWIDPLWTVVGIDCGTLRWLVGIVEYTQKARSFVADILHHPGRICGRNQQPVLFAGGQRNTVPYYRRACTGFVHLIRLSLLTTSIGYSL